MNTIGAISKGLILPVAGLVAAAGIGAVIVTRWPMSEPPAADHAPAAAPVTSKPVAKPAAAARDQGPLAATQRNVDELAAGLGSVSPPPAAAGSAPGFDVVRIEPTGEAVIAGHAAPGATVELLRDGVPHDRAVADQNGQFAMVPPPLPPGNYGLTLRVRQPDGKELTSKQSVAVALEASAGETPMVALMTPDKPTVVVSRPPAAAPVGEAVAVDAVDVEPDGKMHVSGRAPPGAAVRLYLNDSFVTSATAGADGHLSVTINEGVKPGSYKVRLDQVESSSGAVRARAEVPFNVPDLAMTASVPAQTKASGAPETAATEQPPVAAAVADAPAEGASPSAVVVPKIATVTVSRGDSLWRISRRALGTGERYAVVYRANRKQIRNPNLIYPGQVFVLPNSEARR